MALVLSPPRAGSHAALAPGTLVCIYSTNLDRATELLKAAKMYIGMLAKTHPLAPAAIVKNLSLIHI